MLIVTGLIVRLRLSGTAVGREHIARGEHLDYVDMRIYTLPRVFIRQLKWRLLLKERLSWSRPPNRPALRAGRALGSGAC